MRKKWKSKLANFLRFLLKKIGEPEYENCTMCTILEQRLKDVIRAMGGVIFFSVNKKGIFKEVFGGGLQVMATKESRIKGKSALWLYRNNQNFLDAFYSALEGNQSEIETSLTVKRDEINEEVFFRIFFHPYYHNGEIVGVIGLCIDITQVVKALRAAEQADHLKTLFLANMSHEIRTPMNAIIGFSNLLQSDPSKKNAKEYLPIIERNGYVLLNLIDDILDFSIIESGQIRIYQTSFCLKECVEIAVASFGFKEKEKDIQIYAEENLECLCITSDKARLQQILNNLISNAVKFTEKGYVKVSYKREEEMIHVIVEDTGMGIPESMYTAIFDRFIRRRDIDKNYENDEKPIQGTGLGLSICKSLVYLLGGKIWVESQEEKGSTFHFTLPYIPGKCKENGVSLSTQENTKQDVQSLCILIAEDEETNYALLKITLEKEGYNVLRAVNGKEAVEMAQNADVILMDIHMPIMDGFKATEQILKEFPDKPIIAQTAYALKGDKEKGLKFGFVEYITKPIDIKKLLTIIKQVSSP